MIDDWRTVHPFEEGQYYSPVKRALNRIITSVPYTLFSTYSGSNSSYGFYAPSVGSEFMLSFKVMDATNTIIGLETRPELNMDESKLRFDLCTMPVQDMLLDTSSVASTYTKIMMHQIAAHFLNKYEAGVWVMANIYVYKYPGLEAYLNRKGPREVSEMAAYKFKTFK